MKKLLFLPIIAILLTLTSCFDNIEGPSNDEFLKLSAKNLEKGEAFLAENAKKEDVITLVSGLQYKIERAGTGESPKLSDKVKCHYKGTFINGTTFDSSYARNKASIFPVNGVIKGWTEALQLMKVGAKWQLFIPANLAYGTMGASSIGPNETLIFTVELIDIVD
jgi:FKBP-type peptidyl-prolyl cis-trans isomerase FklB